MVGHAGSTTGIVHADMTLTPIQGQGQGNGAFEVPKISEAVHAGGDHRRPPCGAFWLLYLHGCKILQYFQKFRKYQTYPT